MARQNQVCGKAALIRVVEYTTIDMIPAFLEMDAKGAISGKIGCGGA